ncbi:MAG: hypothetical protein ACI840_002403 [Ulvibacter sp.]|jgi:hypothetical protein
MKNLLPPIAALLFTVSSVAQLYVKPNGSEASYIYVKDEVLFVEDDISLAANPSGATEASIYFRDGAQLVQGTGTTDSSGDGYISILQNNTDSDAYDYAYWGSPVGDQTIAGTGNKNFGAMRFFNPEGGKDVGCDCYLGTDSTVNDPITSYNGEFNPEMKISSRWLYTYTNNVWSRIYDNSDVIPGRGFTMKGLGLTNHDQAYDFRGRANNGTITAPILAGASSLSGNPYPSALDLNKFFYDNTNIQSIRFWEEDRTVDSHYYVDNKGGYGIWLPMGLDSGQTNPGIYAVAPFWNYNNVGGQGTYSGNSGDSYQRRFAPVGQGFMLYGANTATGPVTYDNSQRSYILESSGLSDFRSNDGDPVVTDGTDEAIDVIYATPTDYRISHLRLNTYFNETHLRQLVLAFSDDATDGADRGFDALSPMDSTSDVYFPIGSDEKRPYVIQTIPFDIYKQIPYTIDLDIQTRVVVNVIEKVKFKGSVYLYDNVEDTYQEIKSDLERSAELTLPAGTYEDRFFISFMNRDRTQQVVIENAKNQVLEDVDFFQNNPAQQLEVGNPEGYDIASANIFGMSGKLVYTASNLGNNNKFTFPTGNLSDGIYLVMLTTIDNIAVNYKITVKNN